MKVNFLDLKAQYATIKDEIDEAIRKVIEKTAFAAGPFVKEFEEEFAAVHKARFCVGVNSGTSALHAAMMVLGIGPGDEVIVPTNTFFATPEAVSLTGATPVFVDCEDTYYNIDPEKVAAAVTAKTKAIIPVHLYGQPAQLDKIKDIAARHSLEVVEDCAQAHIAEYKGKPVGTTGVMGCFSFYPGKNLGAYGEGGAVTTNDEALYKKLLALRDHGSSKKYYHDFIGHNYRMEGIQGAILRVKLNHLDGWVDARRRNAGLYRDYLKDVKEIVLPEEMPGAKHVYHLFVIRAPRREELQDFLSQNQIYTGIHYPIPCHLQKAYEGIAPGKGSCPISEKYADEIVSLPMFAELTEEEIAAVAEKIAEFYGK